MHDVRDPTWLCERIVDTSGDAVVFADRDGVIRLWNRGAEGIFGYSGTEAIGRTLDLIIPEKLRGRHWGGYRRVIETGVTRYDRDVLAVPAMCKNGSRRSIEFTVALVRNDGGSLVGIVAILRDVTARFEEERRLRARLRALEERVEDPNEPPRWRPPHACPRQADCPIGEFRLRPAMLGCDAAASPALGPRTLSADGPAPAAYKRPVSALSAAPRPARKHRCSRGRAA